MADNDFNLIGSSTYIFRYAYTKGEENDFHFFKPFSSPIDCVVSASSIVTAPLVFGGMTLASICCVGWNVLATIGNCLRGDFSKANDTLTKTLDWSYIGVLSLIHVLLSPLINLIEFIGNVIKTVYQATSEPAVNNAPATI
jgi:hypothetical protein